MPDTLEKRIGDLEYVLAHLPEDLDARFAGVDTKLSELREILPVHTTRFTKIDRSLADIGARLDTIIAKLQAGK